MKLLKAGVLGLGICGLVNAAEVKLDPSKVSLPENESCADSVLLDIKVEDRYALDPLRGSRLILDFGKEKRYIGFKGKSEHIYYEFRISGSLEFDPVYLRFYYETAKIDIRLKMEIRR